MCLRPLKKELGSKKEWIKQPINTIKSLISNSYILDRRKIKKKIKSVKSDTFEVRLAKNFKDIDMAQNLRYKVFYEELKAKPSIKNILHEKDFDELDPFCDHLLVFDCKKGSNYKSIVGTYRLIRRPMTQIHGKFYTESEFNINKILLNQGEILELGRSCVHPNYRNKPIIKLLWKAISAYIIHYKIKILFGCASFPGNNITRFKQQFSYLYHNHLAPPSIRPVALKNYYVPMNYFDKNKINNIEVFQTLPPLIKGYLRLGVQIGDGAVIDKQFNTIDICIVLKTNSIQKKYLKHLNKKKIKSSKIILLNKFLRRKNK